MPAIRPLVSFDTLEPRRLLSGGPTVTGFKISPRTPVAGTGSMLLIVTYHDADGIDPTSFDNRDLRVAGPNDFVRYARVTDSSSNGDGTVRFVRYKLGAPNRVWNEADNGVYTIRLQGGSVSDTLAHFNDPKKLDPFTCKIASPGASLPQSVGASTAHFATHKVIGDVEPINDLLV